MKLAGQFFIGFMVLWCLMGCVITLQAGSYVAFGINFLCLSLNSWSAYRLGMFDLLYK